MFAIRVCADCGMLQKTNLDLYGTVYRCAIWLRAIGTPNPFIRKSSNAHIFQETPQYKQSTDQARV